MRYAYFNNTRVEPSKTIKDAICPICGSKVYPACGNVNVHHFRHENKLDCDPWYEPMSEWHLSWQNSFPESMREVTLERNQVIHRADIFNNTGTVIEFQSSPIKTDDIKAREEFYDQMVWVFNECNNSGFSIFEGKHYYWSNPKKSVFSCTKPVFIDHGGDYLYWINKDRLGMPKFRTNKRSIPEMYGADFKIRISGCGWSYSYYLCYPVRRYLKSEFISHYAR